ncbi:MAG: FAD-binding protein [Ruminobacter sp.]|nr:FAD-binding protein [Ruminobacter sp.]
MLDRIVYDIAVIGLGPAGSTFARLVDSRKLRVAAFDKKDDTEESFRKPCGGLLSPDAQKLCARFSLTLPSDVLVTPQIFSVQTIDLGSKMIRDYQRFYINMDRHAFDKWLKSLIPDTVEIHDGTVCTAVTKNGDLYEIDVTENGSHERYLAKHIVAADGANSVVRRNLFPKRRIKTYMSVQQWFRDEHAKPFYSCIFDRELTDCYAWGLSKNGYFIFGGAFPVKNARERFESMKTKLDDYGFLLENPVKTEACMVLSPTHPWQLFPGKDKCFFLGEAAGFISPSSLEGISHSFESAYRLSELFNVKDDVTASDYRKATLMMRLKLFLKIIKRPFIMNPLLRRIIMKLGICSIRKIDGDDVFSRDSRQAGNKN